jgi:sialate O-acetylesterase
MFPRSRALHICAMVLLVAAVASAEVKLPSVISSRMVLQRQIPAAVWGHDTPGQKVTVQFAGQTQTAVADAAGKWMLRLKPLKASSEPRKMTIAGSSTVTLEDVLVGEVWVCSGQSNMALSVSRSTHAEQALAQADRPTLRMFKVPAVTARQPQENVAASWTVSTSQSAAGFSAVGYFFGVDLMQKLDVPVGLIGTSWGGTRSEAWTRYGALEAQSSLAPLLDWWKQRAAEYDPDKAGQQYQQQLAKWEENGKKGRKPQLQGHPADDRHYPARLYNAMLAPLIPYAVRGAIWYQGESNDGRAFQYRTVFTTMIKSWRDDWNQPVNHDFPFYFVQLAPYTYGAAEAAKPQLLPELWDAETYAYKTLPNVGFAVTTDVTTINDIHPPNKQPVGERLARWALAKDYGKKLVYSGPIFDRVEFKEGKAIIHFEKGTAEGLKTSDDKAPDYFTIAGADRQFQPAEAKIVGNTLVVSAEAVKEPVAVRFAWRNIAEPNLFNAAGLPASPFRTDDFELLTKDKHF